MTPQTIRIADGPSSVTIGLTDEHTIHDRIAIELISASSVQEFHSIREYQRWIHDVCLAAAICDLSELRRLAEVRDLSVWN